MPIQQKAQNTDTHHIRFTTNSSVLSHILYSREMLSCISEIALWTVKAGLAVHHCLANKYPAALLCMLQAGSREGGRSGPASTAQGRGADT